MFYILDDDGEPVVESDTVKWAKWYEGADRVVRQEKVHGHLVSTVFLSLDHRLFPFDHGDPILYETMILAPDGMWLDYQERYTNRHAALAGHDQTVAAVRSGEIGVGS